MTTATLDTKAKAGPKPLTEGKQSVGILIGLWSFVVVPFLAVLAAIPVAWGRLAELDRRRRSSWSST